MSDTIISQSRLKRCKNCDNEYPDTSEFFAPRKTMLSNVCRECTRNQHAEACRRYSKKHPERVLQSAQKYLGKYPDRRKDSQRKYREVHAEQIRESSKEYCAVNAERIRVKSREWRRNNPDTARRSTKEYRRRNPIVARVAVLQRRTLRMLLPLNFTKKDWNNALEHFGHKCAVCGRPIGLWHTLAADHWIPLSSPNCPGTIPTNIIPLCHGDGGCNNSKHDRDPVEWLTEKFGKRKAHEVLKRIEAYFASVAPQA